MVVYGNEMLLLSLAAARMCLRLWKCIIVPCCFVSSHPVPPCQIASLCLPVLSLPQRHHLPQMGCCIHASATQKSPFHTTHSRRTPCTSVLWRNAKCGDQLALSGSMPDSSSTKVNANASLLRARIWRTRAVRKNGCKKCNHSAFSSIHREYDTIHIQAWLPAHPAGSGFTTRVRTRCECHEACMCPPTISITQVQRGHNLKCDLWNRICGTETEQLRVAWLEA
ncbi:hypothetical protein BCR34DRAFT_265176 [Clohesyomyces aquaticus]|uniref:Secreted protein n=1 Tax=Clohesyomyces aquaticus TaxID=1231657 RepID=A0A1Y1ZTF6_9PLEO|nr:hypothetical protein BCR34DRAFT_265176 [Clohesyomyces aquaticus]